jgi:transcriptional regulator with XRE-family HTH domain
MTNSLHTPEYATFRRILIAKREQAGITQSAIAESLGVPQSFVSKYESGERRIDVVEFVQICQAIDVSPESVIRELMKQAGLR